MSWDGYEIKQVREALDNLWPNSSEITEREFQTFEKEFGQAPAEEVIAGLEFAKRKSETNGRPSFGKLRSFFHMERANRAIWGRSDGPPEKVGITWEQYAELVHSGEEVVDWKTFTWVDSLMRRRRSEKTFGLTRIGE